ncbi:MAG: phosphoribosylamine--glycine ligase [Clostridiales bacterium]|nr:phosphoribosylamine--glycine ligase [Clostridiales bacterium]
MKVLIVGGGGREHTIALKIAENPQVTQLYAAPGNGGMAALCQCVPLKATDVAGITAWAKENAIDFVVVAPDDPLCLGMVDALSEAGIPAFGPNKAAAIIEGSKVFSKNLMKKYGIPTAAYEAFTDFDAAVAYLQTAEMPIVVKADGLALGKGVLICNTREEAVQAVSSMMKDEKFGASGRSVVIEEFLTGPEVSVLAFTDGKTIKPMVSSMDHKRALDGDAGLNTGGMGTIAPNPCYTPELAERCMQEIFLPTVAAMNAEGRTFKGCLYFGLMMTPKGPKVIEYNCRFGDPETQVVLPLLKSDLLTIMQSTVNGTLAETPVEFDDGAACCVVLASGGYPVSYKSGYVISGLEAAAEDALVIHAGTKKTDEGIVTAGGRVLGVVGRCKCLPGAISKAYAAARKISFTDMHMRSDIGQRALRELEAQTK